MTIKCTYGEGLLVRLITTVALTGGLMGAAIGTTSAQEGGNDYSAIDCDEVEVVSHAAPGGGTDQTIRMWTDQAAKDLGTNFVVVYKQGGGARVAHAYLQQQPADGCTIMGTTQTHLYTIARGMSPLTIDDLQGVARAMQDPSVIVVRGDSEISSYEDLIKASKENESGLNWGVAQVAGSEHLGIANWADASGVPYRVVPFGSGGEMITALRSGAVDATLANVSEALTPIQDGDLKPIAVLSDDPVKDLSDVPTAASKGDEVSVNTTRGYVVRADTDPEVVAALEKLLLSSMRTERFQNYLTNAGLDPETSIAGADEWDKQLKANYAKAAEIIKMLGLEDQ